MFGGSRTDHADLFAARATQAPVLTLVYWEVFLFLNARGGRRCGRRDQGKRGVGRRGGRRGEGG